MQKHQRRRGITLSLALHVYQVDKASLLACLDSDITLLKGFQKTLKSVAVRARFEGLLFLQVNPNNTYLSAKELSMRRPVCCSPAYSSRREVVLRSSLPPGSYIIIPSTSEPNQQGQFLLRVLTEQGNRAH